VRVSGLGVRVSVFGDRVSGFGFRREGTRRALLRASTVPRRAHLNAHRLLDHSSPSVRGINQREKKNTVPPPSEHGTYKTVKGRIVAQALR